MRRSLDDAQLAAFLCGQLNALYPDSAAVSPETVMEILPETLRRVEHCFSRISNKYFFDGKQTVFDHLHGDQYAMFLYLFANTAHRKQAENDAAKKAYLLNKALHGIDAFYEVELPSVFLFIHPLATVLGRGEYADFLLVYQRCGIGSNHDVYPKLGEHLTLRPGSAVLGRSRIGARSTIAAESLVLDRDLEPDTVYIGNPRDHKLRRGDGPLAVWRTT